eukprot:scaffold364_cov401-Prasinococcus_capsulatus_cf.AAC.10
MPCPATDPPAPGQRRRGLRCPPACAQLHAAMGKQMGPLLSSGHKDGPLLLRFAVLGEATRSAVAGPRVQLAGRVDQQRPAASGQ